MPSNIQSGSLGKNIDTGTGGFSIDGAAYTYSTADSSAVNPTPPITWSSGDIKVNKDKKDLTKETKITLSSYLSKTTLGETNSSPTPVKNIYAVEHNAGDPPKNFNLIDAKGYPQSIANVEPTQPHFSDIGSSRSSKSSTLNVLRGREEPTITKSEDGNTLLFKSMDPMTGVLNPPNPGEINTGRLRTTSPVNNYTRTALTEEAFNNKKYVPEDKSPPLRSLSKLDAPYSGLIPQDISTSKKKSLADYLSKATQDAKNSYPIDGSSTLDLKLTDEKGYPQHLTHISSTQPHFADLEPGRSSSATSLNILRGKEDNSNAEFDGNSLLYKDVAPPVKKYYSEVISANRFNSEEKYEDFSGINSKQFAKKYPLGESLPPEDPRRDVTFGRLAQVGNVLSLRASQELHSLSNEFNPTNSSAQAGALLPGKQQLGIEKISASELTARSVIDKLTKEGLSEELFINPAGESWGSLNNIQDEFSGISAFGMQLLAVALIVALSIVMTAMSALFLLPSGNDTSLNEDIGQRRPLGSSSYNSASIDTSVAGIFSSILAGKFNFWRMMGVESTVHPVEKCLPVGALAFFGVNSTEATFSSMAKEIAKGSVFITQNPGYYSVIARNVSRSYLQIRDIFATVGKAFASGLTSGVKQLLSIIEVFRSSKFIRTLNVFAHLGDQVLDQDSAVRDENSIGFGTRYITEIDRADNRSGGKGRIKIDAGDKSISPLTLSWSSYRAPDMLLMTQNMKNLLSYNILEPNDITPNIPVGAKTGGLRRELYKEVQQSSPRISSNDREDLEHLLDAEYVPFYIHDVRTNEIISFHAFLSSLTDDYTANYDTSEGIGRIEPIKIYKSTNRKIAFSFYVAATNPNDFDSMWLKINKLTTLIYPQFSEGRKINSGDNTLFLPFSQVIQSSPLVRLRIGDLIKSNYSRFALSRLFGIDNPETTIDGEQISLLQKSREDVSKSKDPVIGYFYTSSALFPLNGKNVPLPAGLVLKYQLTTSDKYTCIVEVAQGDDAVSNQDSAELSKNPLVNKIFNCHPSHLHPTQSTLKKIEDKVKQAMQSGSDYESKIKVFMDDKISDKGNAIVKSFRSSGGKGLAGFIESMSFDWYDKVTWEIDPGRKAPKMCKVTISFSPIHDIAPGLDYTGLNRAPIYSVKGLNKYEKKYTNNNIDLKDYEDK